MTNSRLIQRAFLLIGIFFLFFESNPARAQEKPAIKTTLTPAINVWPEGKMPGGGAEEPESYMPAKPDGFTRITNISRPTLSMFRAVGTNRPAMIICPGGGYNYVVFDKEGTEISAWLNKLGITAFVLKYRVPKNREGALQDLQRSISLIREHSQEWNVDPKHIGVIGFSAGGNVAAKASNLFDRRSYTSLDTVDKQSPRPDFVALIYPAYLDQNSQLAADLNIKARIPATFIVTTEDDAVSIAGSKIYHAALDAAKIPNQLLVYPDGGHGYALRSDKSVRAWPAEAEKWFRKIGVIK